MSFEKIVLLSLFMACGPVPPSLPGEAPSKRAASATMAAQSILAGTPPLDPTVPNFTGNGFAPIGDLVTTGVGNQFQTYARTLKNYFVRGGAQITDYEVQVNYRDYQNYYGSAARIDAYVHFNCTQIDRNMGGGCVIDEDEPENQTFALDRQADGSFQGFAPEEVMDHNAVIDSISLAFHADGGGQWDSNDGANYTVQLDIVTPALP